MRLRHLEDLRRSEGWKSLCAQISEEADKWVDKMRDPGSSRDQDQYSKGIIAGLMYPLSIYVNTYYELTEESEDARAA